MHPLGALGANFEVFPGTAQFKVRTPGAILHFPVVNVSSGTKIQPEATIWDLSQDRRAPNGPHLIGPSAVCSLELQKAAECSFLQF
eukprot:7488846-Alexandrium_andersonii.AAC.1